MKILRLTLLGVALLFVGCTPAQKTALSALAETDPAQPSTTLWSPPPSDFPRIPGTRLLHPNAPDGEMCISDVAPQTEPMIGYDGSILTNEDGSPRLASVTIPCNQILNPCHMDDLWRTTMFYPQHLFCTDGTPVLVDGVVTQTEDMASIEEACATEHPEWYGCDNR